MTKRVFKLISVLLVVTFLLIGCSKPAPAPAPPAAGEEPVETVKFPTGPIEIVIPGEPGGGVDRPARVFVPFLEAELGVPIVPVNLAGATGAIAYTSVARASSDGYIIGYTTSPSYELLFVQGNLYADPRTEYEQIAKVIFNPQAITVRADSPFETFADLVKYAEANPEELVLAHAGAASVKAMIGNTMADQGAKLRDVHLEGDTGIIVGLLGGHVDVGVLAAPQALPYHESGELRVLVTSGAVAGLDVPTFRDIGYNMPIGGTTHAFLTPKGVDPEILAILRKAFENVMNNPEFQAKAAEAKLSLDFMDGESYSKVVRDLVPFLEEYNSRR